MNKIKLMAFLLVLLFSVPASAEYYRYLDKNGKVRYTDDYSKVPENQRSSAGKYTGYEDGSTGEPANDETESDTEINIETQSEQIQETEEGLEGDIVSSKTSNTKEPDTAKIRLEQKQQEINEELDALNGERKMLDALKEKTKTKQQIIEYNSKIGDYNKKVKEFTGKQRAFEAEVEKYNNDLENSMKNSLKQFNEEKKEKQNK